jgi:hypothetical protein
MKGTHIIIYVCKKVVCNISKGLTAAVLNCEWKFQKMKNNLNFVIAFGNTEDHRSKRCFMG